MDHAANLALFLVDRAGSCLAVWRGRLTAAEQRGLFGRYLGRGMLWINGDTETIEHCRKVCFGHDIDVTSVAWRDLS